VLAAALIAAANTTAQAPSQAPAAAVSAMPVVRTVDVGKNQGSHERKMDKNIKVEKNPDAALIEYLGEYDDAADGLDPMGLAESEAPPDKTGDGKR
jgi:hypothetical protein